MKTMIKGGGQCLGKEGDWQGGFLFPAGIYYCCPLSTTRGTITRGLIKPNAKKHCTYTDTLPLNHHSFLCENLQVGNDLITQIHKDDPCKTQSAFIK